MALPALSFGTEHPEPQPVEALQIESFNTTFLKGAPSAVDLQQLLQTNSVLPGNYRVDLYNNGVLAGRKDVDFRRNPQTGVVEACLNLDLLQLLGIDIAKLMEQGRLDPEVADACYDLASLIDQAVLRYDSTRLRLNASIPQIAMLRGRRGYVDPALWDNGVNAAFVNYQLNTYRNRDSYGRQTSNNLGLRNGINLGSWRLRNESNFRTGTGQRNTFKSNRTYLQHDVTRLKGQFTLGEIYSDSDLFDSVRYRGIKLASDEGMRADSERGYAPVIRGVAETNATVEIRQNDYILYSTNVSPGPFEISDIFPTGSNGDLEVTIIEADGRRRVSLQAFSSLPTMVREGQLKYSLSAGQFNSNSDDQNTPGFVSTTLTYGLSSNFTGIVGAQATQNFNAVSVGAGRNTSLGAVSVDLTHSASRVQGLSARGNSLRALYAKTFTGTDTSFTLAAYRYSTEGYRTLSDHVQELSSGLPATYGRSKIRTDLTVSQTLGAQKYGNLYVNASDERYWNRGGSRSYSAGYSNGWRDVSYNFSVSQSRNIGGATPSNNDTQFNLSVSFPLGSKPRAPRAYASTSHRKDSDSSQLGVNGYLSDENDLSYSVQGSRNSGTGGAASATLMGRTSMADVSLGYSKGRDYRSESLSVAGSLVAHAGGINLGQPVGETFALAEVPDTPGVGISSYSGASTGYNGYAIVPNAQPYRVNWVTLDTRNLGGDIEIDNATQQVVPRRGAIVLARFEGKKGRRVQFQLFDSLGKPIPFGASLEDASGKQLAISDPSGRALALVEEEQATLTIKWSGNQCSAAYALPPQDKLSNYERYRLSCQG
ncbi:fimbria/pilus outer membrane usher protein [Pseudomonas sp. BN415]|uniref:fimbria/pilus outer membrane usher protein n=1 Tax=Pseudomonas sp. BN415 TaxID=2567889 RepID=UPI0024547DCA|nr:fimbria/pilus outer membrane usher protein [Pseudomonas sp. BN415]